MAQPTAPYDPQLTEAIGRADRAQRMLDAFSRYDVLPTEGMLADLANAEADIAARKQAAVDEQLATLRQQRDDAERAAQQIDVLNEQITALEAQRAAAGAVQPSPVTPAPPVGGGPVAVPNP